MLKDSSSVRITQSVLKNTPVEGNENVIESELHEIHVPSLRTPLDSIPDPSQYQRGPREIGDKPPEGSQGRRLSVRKIGVSDSQLAPNKALGSINGLSYGTPRVYARGKTHSEPNSAQSTPARNSLKVSITGSLSGVRPPHSGARGGSNYRVPRGIPFINSEQSIEVPYFELEEDLSFWKDHNVQVLLRIRPLSNAEMVSQGYGRCLRQESAQTLVWLGHPESRFTFDHIACEMISQEKLFKVVGLPMVDNCMSGYNSCIFAYGQTGSGKTYTMMGEICQMDGKLDEDCGITPRIFKYLFTNIREEEENRQDERLNYVCKCSFLEIYNEQITDLLEPSSTNLQVREDLKKGVYVENLTEHTVRTVNDVLKLLLQGAANRKMAATYMNSESSRSHSVFTCTVESHWEKDSMTHLRFGRLNLVDLAGSERQKSSGAEGDRLKEAANINKSLSTLGLVIMSLVDLAHGKHRHVPYRDSRLTFLLQDSLGGNSKTTIIANISPSTCATNETLSTLKFAQRAKLIQNNAIVNEDASGNVTALQHQIQKLQGQLSFLMKHHNISRSFSSSVPSFKQPSLGDSSEEYDSSDDGHLCDDNTLRVQERKIKGLEATLASALRREKLAQIAVRRLEAENEGMNRLAQQREDDAWVAKMMLRICEEKIRRLELFADGSVSADKYVMEENSSLKEENQLVRKRIDRNPELTRIAIDNTQLLDQLRLFQELCEQGERENMLAEISELRDQLMESLERNYDIRKFPFSVEKQLQKSQDNNLFKELEDCKNMNSNLIMNVDELQAELRKFSDQAVTDSTVKDPEDFKQVDAYSSDETISTRCIGISKGISLDRMAKELEKAQLLNCQYQEDHALQLSQNQQIQLVCEQVEMETTKTILHLQEEVAALQSELKQKLSCMVEENVRLRDTVAAKEDEIRTLSKEWESATLELTSFLVEGSKYLRDASGQVEKIVCSFPYSDLWLGEHVEKAAKVCIEKEETILLLQKSLEDAQEMVLDMEQKLNSLKGAAHVLAGVQQQENQATGKETTKLTMLDMSGDLPMPYDAPIIELERSSNDVFEEVFVRNNITENVTLPKMVISFERGGQHIPEMALALEDIKGQVELAKQGLLETEDAIYLCSIDANEYMSALQRNIHEASFLYRELVQGFEKNINETREKIVELKHSCRSCHFLMVKASSQEAHNIPEHEFEHFLLHQVRNEVLRTSDRLRTITASIEIALNMYDYTSKVKGLVEKGDFDAACSTSRSDTSIDHVAPENDSDESRSGGSNSFDGEITAQFFNLEPEEGSNFSTDDQESEKLKGLAKIYIDDKTTVLHLRRELKRANDAFDKLDVQLAAFLHKKSTVDCSYQGIYFREPLEILYADEQDIHRNAHYQHTMSKLSPVLQLTELKEQVGEADYQSMKEFWGSQSINNEELSLANSLFTKLEEALATTKEADMMLNALLKANENAQRMTCMWKQECEKLIMEKASAINEVEQLNSSIRFKDAENEILQDQIKCSLKEVANLMSLFEGSFLNMQIDVDEMFKVMFADAITMAQDLLHCFCNSKLSFEAIYSTIVEQGFASVLYQCNLGEILRKFISPTDTSGFHEDRPQKSISVTNSLSEIDNVVGYWKGEERGNQSEVFKRVDGTESGTANNSLINENSLLKKELERKEDILKGLLFDFSLLQESASTKKDMKDEAEKLILAFSQLQQELQIKTDQLNDLLVQHSQLQARFVDTENALVVSNSDLEQAKGTVDGLSDQIDELSVLLKDMYLRKSEVEEKLEEQSEVVKTLEKEILRISSSAEEKLLSSIEDIEVNFRSVPTERDQLLEQVQSLQDKLDMAYSLVDENEAIAIEARQESEASKVYAEQKEEEVRILEHSVQELECTVNVLEKKVYEMEEELEKHKLIRDSLSLELQSLKQRMLTVESFSEDTYSENSNTEQPSEDQLSRQLHKGFLELHKAQNWIRLLEEERAEQAKEIKQCKEYISELVLHAEAQALQYQQKYKTLEEMVREVNRDSSTITSASLTEDKPEKSLMKPRGSSSPFRCIAGLVQQMNLEKDQELSAARLHIAEVEALAANRQKQVCMLNTRLAAAESMTHDVIRDLLGVKLDITNYANMIDQYQLQKLVENAQLQTKESTAMEKEILNLSRQINDLVEERERFIAELNRRQADVLAAQVTVEQLQERGQFLTTQNEMMKADNSNLKRRIVELDEIVKKLFATQSTPVQIQQQMKVKQRGDNDLARRLEKSEKLLLRVNDELAQYRKSNCGNAPVKVDVHVLERRARNLE